MRGHFQLQHRVDVLDGNRVVDGRLNRNLCSLLNGGLFVVLRDDFGLRQQFADALRLRCGDHEIQREIRRGEQIAHAARRSAGSKVRDQWHRHVRCRGIAAWNRRLAVNKCRRCGYARNEGAEYRADAYGGVAAKNVVACGRGKSELRPDILSKRSRCRYHPRFNLHLLGLAVQLRSQIVNRRYDGGNVADDQSIRTVIRKNVAPRGEELLECFLHGRGLCITQDARHGNRINRLGLRFHQVALRLRLGLQCRPRGDPQNVAVQLLVQAVVLQHDVQSLVPGHFIQNDRQAALHGRVQHHVQPADLMDQAEEVAQIHVFQVDRDRFSRVPRG